MNLLTREEYDDLDDDHPAREAFDSYEEYQRYQVAQALDTVDTFIHEYRAVAAGGAGLALGYLAIRGLDDLLGPY